MNQVSFLRHAGWFGPSDATKPLNIIGVGATGSNIGLIAAKMGFQTFKVWDPDIVENHNLPNQIYDIKHIGTKKVDAFEDVLTRFNPNIIVEKSEKYFSRDHREELSGPLVLTVDTMEARKEIYHAFRTNWKVNNVFETRVGFDYAEVNVVDNMNTEDSDSWFNCLRNDDEIPEGPCNLRICTTLVTMVAAHTVHTICNMLSSDTREKRWEYSQKTIFNFNPKLLTHNL